MINTTVRLAHDTKVYHDLIAPKGTVGKIVDYIGGNPKKPEGYYVEIITMWFDKEVPEILEVGITDVVKVRERKISEPKLEELAA